MISAVSKNPINNYRCNYQWMRDDFMPQRTSSENHHDCYDMTGLLIKSLGFGD